MRSGDHFLYPEGGIEMYRQQLAEYERTYVNFDLGKALAQLRVAFKEAVLKVHEKIKQNPAETVRTEAMFKEELEGTLPEGFEYVASGSEANIVKFSHTVKVGTKNIEKTFALKMLYQPGEAAIDSSWASLGLDEEEEPGIDAATKLALGLDIAKNLSSVNKLVAYSPDEQLIITEFVEGKSALEYYKENKRLDIPDTKLSNFVRSVMEAYKRGLMLDNKLENTLITREKDLIILEFFKYIRTIDEETRKQLLMQAYYTLNEMLRVIRMPTIGRTAAKDPVIELIGGENYVAEAEELFQMVHPPLKSQSEK